MRPAQQPRRHAMRDVRTRRQGLGDRQSQQAGSPVRFDPLGQLRVRFFAAIGVRLNAASGTAVVIVAVRVHLALFRADGREASP